MIQVQLLAFSLMEKFFEKTYFKADAIKSRLHETAYLNPNLTIIFENKRVGEEETVTFSEPDGIKAFIADMTKDKEKVTDIIYFKDDIEGIELEIAFQYIMNLQKIFQVSVITFTHRKAVHT